MKTFSDNFVVVVFAYNRPEKLKKLLQSISDYNSIFKYIKIYIDGAKNISDIRNVDECERIVEDFTQLESGRSYVRRKQNVGLKKNILLGLDQVSKEFEGFIVLEDDLILSQSFFQWHYAYLEAYKQDKKVWHLSAWNYMNMSNLTDSSGVVSPFMNCWGWSTWSDRWNFYKTDFVTKLSKRDIDIFENSGMYEQYDLNRKGEMSTWAIYWHIVILENAGICVNSTIPLVLNEGLDGSGTNSGVWSIDQRLEEFDRIKPIIDFSVSNQVESKIRYWYKKQRGFWAKVKRKMHW